MTTEAEGVAELITELSTSLADLVNAIESQAKDSSEIKVVLKQIAQAMGSSKGADAITAALRSLRFDAPVVRVDVKPTPIEVNLPAPVVQVLEGPKQDLLIDDVRYDNFDRLTSMRIRRVPAKP